MGTLIPGKKKLAWYDRKGLLEAVLSLSAFAVVLLSSYQLYQDPAKRAYAYWTVGIFAIAAFGFFLKIRQATVQDRKEIDGVDHDGIRGAVYVVHAAACHACGLQLDQGLKNIRATFHRVVHSDKRGAPSEPAEYEQIIDYVGRKGGGNLRKFSVNVGITGLAFRLGDVIAAERKSADLAQYQKELIEDWGFTPSAAKQVSEEPMSWLAIPIRESGTDKVIGIVYLDSTAQNAFQTPQVQTAILTACLGVTKYVEQRYKS